MGAVGAGCANAARQCEGRSSERCVPLFARAEPLPPLLELPLPAGRPAPTLPFTLGLGRSTSLPLLSSTLHARGDDEDVNACAVLCEESSVEGQTESGAKTAKSRFCESFEERGCSVSFTSVATSFDLVVVFDAAPESEVKLFFANPACAATLPSLAAAAVAAAVVASVVADFEFQPVPPRGEPFTTATAATFLVLFTLFKLLLLLLLLQLRLLC
mmetsp:Transcript_13119/g.26728  ORF Transcript_13119/g.26728 Transcript_13119/m.26728 type:complete len:215 (-) Transcript_13119:1514-2158(-)